MRHDHSKAILEYWNRLRGMRAAPDRRDIEPSDIRSILGDTFILEVNEAFRSVSFRLAGTRLCNAYGRELKGLGFLALWEEADNFAVYSAVKKVYADFQPCTLSCIAQSEGRRFVEYEIMLLPLFNPETSTKRILGTASPITREAWVGTDKLLNNRVRSIRYPDVDAMEQAPSMVTPVSQAEDVSGNKGKSFGHLTVIDGGRQ